MTLKSNSFRSIGGMGFLRSKISRGCSMKTAVTRASRRMSPIRRCINKALLGKTSWSPAMACSTSMGVRSE